MSGFGELLGFDGRIGRLGYLWRTLAMWCVLAVLLTMGVGVLTFVVKPRGLGGYLVGLQWLTIAASLLALWSSFALASRRLRDMGLEPAYIVPLLAALWVVNAVLLAPLSQLQPERFGLVELGWAGLQVLAALPLLFWPGRAAPATVVPDYHPAGPTAQLDWRANG